MVDGSHYLYETLAFTPTIELNWDGNLLYQISL